MVIYELNGSNSTFENVDIKWLLHEMDQLFFQYIPTVYSAETFSTLNALKEIPNVSMSILSNTAFIKGSTLRVVLKHLDLNQFFNFQLYSDEVGMSKPNLQFFGLMIENIHTIRQNDNINLQEIIHIGDNFVADILGANNLKINSFLINSNNNTIADLLK
jgi:putative hydrolase of the HAD superfamily